MFEGWVADLIASTLGSYLDLTKDRLRISLWEGVLRVCIWAMTVEATYFTEPCLHLMYRSDCVAKCAVAARVPGALATANHHQGRLCWKAASPGAPRAHGKSDSLYLSDDPVSVALCTFVFFYVIIRAVVIAI